MPGLCLRGQAYVVPETKHVGDAQLWPEDLWFANAFGWPWALGQMFGHGLTLAANSDDAGLAGAAPSAFGAYWLAHDPSAGVVVIDHFFERAGDPNPPELSIGQSEFVDAGVLWGLRQPVDLPGFEGPGTVYLIPAGAFPPRIEPIIGPEHGGGAGFTPYDSGSLGAGLVPLLAQPPTALPPRELPHEIHRPPVTGGNHRPVANDDHATTLTNQPVLIYPLRNDFDPDRGDHISIAPGGLRLLSEDPGGAGIRWWHERAGRNRAWSDRVGRGG